MYTHARLGLTGILVALLAGCATAPAPMATMIVPSISRSGELQELSTQAGTVTELMTVDGREQWLLLDKSNGPAFVGREFNPASGIVTKADGPVARVPFDQVALVYYAVPPRMFDSRVPSEQAEFPALQAPGVVEQEARCEDLDVELARAEAIRRYARDQGARLFTSAPVFKAHAKKAALYTARTLFCVGGLLSGSGGGCNFGAASANPGVRSSEDWRQIMMAADRRTVDLLDRKQARQCATREVAGTERGDLAVLAQVENTRHARNGDAIDDEVRMAQETK